MQRFVGVEREFLFELIVERFGRRRVVIDLLLLRLFGSVAFDHFLAVTLVERHVIGATRRR